MHFGTDRFLVYCFMWAVIVIFAYPEPFQRYGGFYTPSATFPYPTPIPAKIRGVPFGVGLDL